MILDLRAQQKPAGPDPRCGTIRNGALVLRDPKEIDAITLHQTGVWFGVSAQQRLAAGGDEALARHRRALRVHAHVTAFRDGVVVPAYPLRAYVWHGNGANGRSIGLEIEGLYNGAPGGKHDEPTPTVIAGAREAVRWIVDEAAKEGIAIRYMLAHRQYSKSRRPDPGWTLWQEVGLWAERELGLFTLPDLTDRDGLPIPKTWDARQVEPY